MLIAGHGRLEAARLLGMKTIPAIVIDGLTEARKRALLLADNRIAQSAGWDRERLAIELLSLPELLSRMISTSRSPALSRRRSMHYLLTSRTMHPIPLTSLIRRSCRSRVTRPETSGSWANIACCAAMRGNKPLEPADGRRARPHGVPRSALQCGVRDIGGGAGSNTKNLPWPRARCRKLPSRLSLMKRSALAA